MPERNQPSTSLPSSLPRNHSGVLAPTPLSRSFERLLAVRAAPPPASPTAPPAPAPKLGRKNSADDLAADALAKSPPVKSASGARLLYREWRTGSHIGADFSRVDGAAADSDPVIYLRTPCANVSTNRAD